MSHACSHHHAPKSFNKAFTYGIVLNILIVILEAGAGIFANSLALLADAVHNLGDVLGLVLAWAGYLLAQKKPSERYTFGLGRFSIFATILNGLLLIGSSVWIIFEAVGRWHNPPLPATGIVAIVAFAGIVINAGTALALQKGQHDINIKGAFLHMIGDAAISGAVVISALVMSVWGIAWLDPLLSALLAVFILWTSWPLLAEGLHLAMDGVPSNINIMKLNDFILGQPSITAVNDLRIWAVSTTSTALSAHITLDLSASSENVLRHLQHALKHEFGFATVTLQLETDHSICISDR